VSAAAATPATWLLLLLPFQDMNSYALRFTVFDGDWKAGSGNSSSLTPSKCSNELYAQAIGYLNSLNAPAMYTPGDNEWTDCDRE
jgi:hypothetical protein